MESVELQNFLLGKFLTWLPEIIYGIFLVLAIALYLKSKYYPEFKLLNLTWKKLIVGTVSFQFFYAGLITWAQYYIWSKNGFTNILLNSPVDKEALGPILNFFFPLFDHRHGYFAFYVFGRFWLEVLIIWGLATLFYCLLRLSSRHRMEFFEPGEIELGLLVALIAGWPNFVIFIPLMLGLTLLFSMYRLLVLKQTATTLAWPLILAGALTLIFGGKLLILFNLTTLKI